MFDDTVLQFNRVASSPRNYRAAATPHCRHQLSAEQRSGGNKRLNLKEVFPEERAIRVPGRAEHRASGRQEKEE